MLYKYHGISLLAAVAGVFLLPVHPVMPPIRLRLGLVSNKPDIDCLYACVSSTNQQNMHHSHTMYGCLLPLLPRHMRVRDTVQCRQLCIRAAQTAQSTPADLVSLHVVPADVLNTTAAATTTACVLQGWPLC